ncbi:hypothetical protein SDC9_55211 [bioreactor metagenome]|uniref:HD-CE domain-containing protein n=1 Tax=bioreactor metagenome TaxID=1076179 RepID=A0A644WYA5_9ZZZZ
MILKNSTLDEWLKKPKNGFLKRGGDKFPFFSKYHVFKDYLDNGLQREVTKQAIYHEIQEKKELENVIWLNDHGPDHIAAVVERASQLLDNGKEDTSNFMYSLNAREVFLLLNAIQVHDVGNFFGRVGHEEKVLEAVNNGLTPILFDSTEAKYIYDIAHVHGGKVTYKNGSSDKNTIKKIKQHITSDGYDVRLQLLAAILRFADELADEKKRADILSLNNGSLTKGSEVFHAFSACLDSVKVDHSKLIIEVHFKIPKKYATRKFGKLISENGINKVVDCYLIDEIYSRLLKMHQERIYCSKFWKSMIEIDRIWVEIEFYNDSMGEETIDFEHLQVHPDITFTLHDNGYPSGSGDIFSCCDGELKYQDGSKIDGENLFKKIS